MPHNSSTEKKTLYFFTLYFNSHLWTILHTHLFSGSLSHPSTDMEAPPRVRLIFLSTWLHGMAGLTDTSTGEVSVITGHITVHRANEFRQQCDVVKQKDLEPGGLLAKSWLFHLPAVWSWASLWVCFPTCEMGMMGMLALTTSWWWCKERQ